MKGAELFTDRRRFRVALTTALAAYFAALTLVPTAAGYLRPTGFVAIGLCLAVLVGAILVDSRGFAGIPPRQVVEVVVLTAALATAMAGSLPERSVDLYLLLFPWIAAYGAMATSLRVAIVNANIVSAGVVAAVVGHGDLATDGISTVIVTVLSVTFSALFINRFSTYTRVQGDRDALTLLASRAGLLRQTGPALARSVAQGDTAVLLLLDVNRFREVNDALGHDAGDELLRLIARELRTVTPAPLFLGRLGSDEFALVMDGSMLSDSPSAAAEQLRGLGRTVLGQIRGPFRVGGVPVEVEASAGIAISPRDGDDLAALLPCADAALHRAKRDGERVGVWDAGMAGVRQWEVALFAELREAISRDELVVHYQPLLSAHTGKIAGVEALVRWQHPQRGLLPPGAFLPMAERSVLIVDVTEWVLDNALRQCASWASAGLHVPVSVNLSARMLVLDELPSMVSSALAKHGLPHDVLTLEITESAFVTQPSRAAAMLRDLRTQGVKLSLDDFGTGYSSMEILKAFPFDEVKIDRGFVSDARGNLSDAAIVRTVLELGHRLGLRVVGEGVEDQETLAMMTELGCDILQGDAVSRPVPPAALEAVLAAGVLPPPKAPHPLAAVTKQPAAATSYGGDRAGVEGDASLARREPVASMSPWRVDARELSADEEFIQSAEHRVRWRAMSAPRPADEDARLSALHRYEILDTPHEAEFDDIAALAAQVCDAPLGTVAFIDSEREWFKASYGIDLVEVPRDRSIAAYAMLDHKLHEVRDATADVRFAHIQFAVERAPRFMASAPVVTPDGYAVGVVGVADRLPRTMSPGQRRALTSLARQVSGLLESRRAVRSLDRVGEALKVLDNLWYPDELTTAASTLAEAAREVLDGDVATVLLSDIPGSTVFHAVASATARGAVPLIKSGVAYTGRDDSGFAAAMRTQTTTFFPDVTGPGLFPPDVVEKMTSGSSLIVPIPGEGAVLGGVAVRWTVPRKQVDDAAMRAVSLLCGQAGHALARLRSAQLRERELGIDPGTGLISREQFLSMLQAMPTGTAVCLLAIGDRPPEETDDQVFRAVAGRLREAAGTADCVARWTENRIVLATRDGADAAADLVARLRAVWQAAEAAPPFVVGTAVTVVDQPPSAALVDAEAALVETLRNSTRQDDPRCRPGNGVPGNGLRCARASGDQQDRFRLI